MILRASHIRLINAFALAQAICLQLFTLWGGITPGYFLPLDVHTILIIWAIPQSIALALTYFLCGRALRSSQPPMRHVSGVMASTLVGALDLACISMYPESAGVLIIISACAWGVTTALMTMGSLVEFQNYTISMSYIYALIALALGSGEYVILNAFVQSTHPLFVCVSVLLYILSMILMLTCKSSSGISSQSPSKSPKTAQSTTPTDANGFSTGDAKRFHEVLRTNFSQVLAFLCALAFTVSLTRTLSLGFLADTSIINIAGALTIMIISGVLFALYRQQLLTEEMFTQFPPEVFRILFSLVATSLVLLALFGEGFALLAQCIMFVLFCVAYVMLIVPTHGHEMRMQLPHGMLFAQVSVYLFAIFGVATYLGAFAMRTLVAGDTTFSVIVIVILYVVAMTYSFVSSNGSLRSIFLPETGEQNPTPDTATSNASPKPAPTTGATSATDVKQPTSDPTLTSDTPVTPSITDTATLPTLSSPLTSTSSSESTDSATSETNRDDAIDKHDSEEISLDQALKQIRADFGLTPREFDVLEFITHGRDVPTIARELVLSENTIRSHIKRLYNKLLAHSKQEVLDIVEGYMHPKY